MYYNLRPAQQSRSLHETNSDLIYFNICLFNSDCFDRYCMSLINELIILKKIVLCYF